MKALRSIHNKFQVHATGSENPALFIDDPENVYWTRRWIVLQGNLSDVAGEKTADKIMDEIVSHTGRENRAMNACLALEVELAHYRNTYMEMWKKNNSFYETEIDCTPLGGW